MDRLLIRPPASSNRRSGPIHRFISSIHFDFLILQHSSRDVRSYFDIPPESAPSLNRREDELKHHTGGLILWSKSFTPAFTALALTQSSPVNSLVKETLIEGQSRGEDDGYEKDGYSVRWTMENGLGLVFVVSGLTSYLASWTDNIRSFFRRYCL
jgi:hypothetical protein